MHGVTMQFILHYSSTSSTRRWRRFPPFVQVRGFLSCCKAIITSFIHYNDKTNSNHSFVPDNNPVKIKQQTLRGDIPVKKQKIGLLEYS